MGKLFSALEQQIVKQSQKYYTDGSNDLTDEQFDALVDKLKEENPQSEVLKTGWGYDVNKDTTPGEKVKHKYGLAGSLDKARTWKEIPRNMRDSEVWVTLKLDGLSVVAYYEHGKLMRALTRGDGVTGIDITNKLGGRCIPNSIHADFTGAIRGEIIMPYHNFDAFKIAHPKAKNPRNSTVGLIGMDEITDDLNYLRVYFYSVFADEDDRDWSADEVYDWLDSHLDYGVPSTKLSLQEDNYYEVLDELHDEWDSYDLPNDGLVLTVSCEHDAYSGYVSYDSVAFKFPAEAKITKVEKVLWEMSKTGYYVPRIQVDPVELSGATVTYATAFNAQFVMDNGIAPGATVKLTRSGEVIPYIKAMVSRRKAIMPRTCPECGDPLHWTGVHLSCLNQKCPNMVRQDLLAWINNVAPLDDFGDTLRLKYIYDLYGRQVVSVEDMMDIMELGSKYQQGGVQDKLFVQMLKLLHTRNLTMVEALLALNVPRLGDKTCARLAQYPGVVKRILEEADTTNNPYNLLDLNGFIGDANAEAIRNNLWKFRRLRYIWNRIQLHTSEDIRGRVAITGKLSVPRKVFEKELSSAGWTCGDITKDTKYLITDDPNSTSSKNQKADKLGIVKITEEEFRQQYMRR